MTDREKLIELLDEVHHRPLGKEYRERLNTIADHLLANGVTFTEETPVVPGHEDQYNIAEMAYNNGYAKGCEDSKPKWIPVSERLPEDNLPRFSNVKQIKVLTALISDKGVRTVRSQMRYKDTWATGHDRWRWKYSGSEITHWMPLPEPPKEE